MKKHEIIKFALDAYEKAAVEISGMDDIKEIKTHLENTNTGLGVCWFFREIGTYQYGADWIGKHSKYNEAEDVKIWGKYPKRCASKEGVISSLQTRIRILRGEHALACLELVTDTRAFPRNTKGEIYDHAQEYDFYFDISDGEISRIEITDKDADVVYDVPESVEDEICEILINRFEIN